MTILADSMYRAAQIREAEQLAYGELHVSGLHLMRMAGGALCAEMLRRWPDRRKLAVFCGPGNNGGDGYVLSTLALQLGYCVKVYSAVEIADLSGDAAAAGRDYLNAGGKVEKFGTHAAIPEDTLVVDALFGIGLNREVGGDYFKAIALINAASGPVLAVDIPSGLHADSGHPFGLCVKADATVTFIGLKCGMHTGQAADYCGDIVLAPLLPQTQLLGGCVPAARLLKTAGLPQRPRSAHKGSFGHVLLIGGNYGYSGAIRLAGEAALRSGAGLVSIATRSGHAALLNVGRPELMCHGVENAEQLQGLLGKAGVVVVGPGLGRDDWAHAMFVEALASGKPLVVDADALNLLAAQPVKRKNWVLTPHPGEAARLLACGTDQIAADRFTAANALHLVYGGVCVLKGAGSLIVDDEGIEVAVTGNPGMASGGMGDVLAGLIGGLVGQRLPLPTAAKLAVHVHGEAADRVAAVHGEHGMLASDLLPELRHCLNAGAITGR